MESLDQVNSVEAGSGRAVRLPPLDLGLRDRVCVVTGSTSGIGRTVAELLVEEGAKVVTSGRRESGPGVGEALHVAGDLAQPDAPAELIRRAGELGPVDCLVNNVGEAYQADFDELTDEQWEQMWQLNVMSFVRVDPRGAAGNARAGEGGDRQCRVDLGEAAVDVDAELLGDESGCSVALAARRGPVREGRNPLERDRAGPDGDRGLARAGRAGRPAGERTGKSREEVLEAVAKGRPLGRLAEPDEIAAVIVFLCSDRANYVTGSAWSADGGTVPIII